LCLTEHISDGLSAAILDRYARCLFPGWVEPFDGELSVGVDQKQMILGVLEQCLDLLKLSATLSLLCDVVNRASDFADFAPAPVIYWCAGNADPFLSVVSGDQSELMLVCVAVYATVLHCGLDCCPILGMIKRDA
jgi:hypothetical protein